MVLSLFILAALEGGVISFGLFGSGAFEALDNEAKTAAIATLKLSGGDPAAIAKAAIDQVTAASKTLYILWVFGFLAGFSERFAWDFVDRAQGIASGAGGAKAEA